MFKVYYDYNCDKRKVTVYSIKEKNNNTMFLICFLGYWTWVNADYCEPCEDEEN